ncbi:hypothetical protein DL764_003875 [Monosporascus ibericus]|uniref:Uncharacterized protein n=1 Tax=Monosporascus ibericus TaxID=155417 RepID=A0A4Q4TGS6_9PEZI|nr:hypothetical protein DL764_003875 [Monosporascus ibericus]
MDPVVIKSHKAVSQVLSDKKDSHDPLGRSDLLPGQPAGQDIPARILPGVQRASEPLEPGQRRQVSLSARAIGGLTRGAPKETFFEVDIDIVRTSSASEHALRGRDFRAADQRVETAPRGVYTERKLYLQLTAMSTSAFFDSDPANSFKLRTLGRELALGLERLVRLEVEADAEAGWVDSVAARLGHWDRYSYQLTLPGQRSRQACCPNAWTTSLEQGASTWPNFSASGTENNAAADKKLVHYMPEGIRLRGTGVVARSIAPTRAPRKVTDDTPRLYDPTDPTGIKGRPRLRNAQNAAPRRSPSNPTCRGTWGRTGAWARGVKRAALVAASRGAGGPAGARGGIRSEMLASQRRVQGVARADRAESPSRAAGAEWTGAPGLLDTGPGRAFARADYEAGPVAKRPGR